MISDIKASIIHLRPAAPEDCELVFIWRNLPEIVQLSSSMRKVSFSEHMEWYEQVLSDESRPVFLIEECRSPVGLIRFEINKSNEAEISIYLLQGKTGRGLGPAAIMLGCDLVITRKNVKKIIANIRKNNTRSVIAFTKCGFELMRGTSEALEHVTLVKLFM